MFLLQGECDLLRSTVTVTMTFLAEVRDNRYLPRKKLEEEGGLVDWGEGFTVPPTP